MNTWNLEMQVQGKSTTDLAEMLCALKTKLMISTTDHETENILHFPQLCTFMSTIPGAQFMPIMTDFLVKLIETFSECFQ